MRKIAAAFAVLLLGLSTLFLWTAADAATANLIANPSVETANSAGTLPISWEKEKWGANTVTFDYKNNDGHSGSRSLYVNMTQRTRGDAKWYFTNIPVKPNQKYTYSEFYKSNVRTEIDVEYLSTSGKYSYTWLGSQAASATNWKSTTASFTTPADVKTLTVFHVINRVGWVQNDDFSLVEGDGTSPAPTSPTVSLTSPSNGATLTGTQTVTANASDAQGLANVQFKLDGNNLGAADTTAPYSVAWDTKTAANGNHVLTAVATNIASLSTTSSPVTVNVQNPTPPTISFSSPAAGATISGTSQAVSASASADTVAVQFKLDGANLGAEDTIAPYSVTWNTTTTPNGNHSLSAVARNAAGMSATATETVNVQNSQPPPPASPNLIPNPSLESSANGTTPNNWLSSSWGTNAATFTYLNSGHSGTRSVKTEITSYTNGAANWYYADLTVTAGKTYKYENWYQSNVDTEVDAEVVMNDGSVQYYWLGVVLANTNWTKFSTTFTVPAGAKSMAIFQILAKVGYVVSDDYSLSEYVPQVFNRSIVSLTFDDAWRSQYQNALPLLQKYNLPATFYILTGEINDNPDYMTVAMMQALKDQGSELAAHTVTHPHLPQLTVPQMDAELSNSQASLRQWFGPTVANNFATPYGEYNSTVLTEIKKFYRSHRGVEGGFNSKDNFDIYDIKVQNITSNTTPAQVQAWVNQAITNKTWLVLVYHEIGANIGGDIYNTTTADLDQELNAIKQSGVAVETVEQALNEILPQL